LKYGVRVVDVHRGKRGCEDVNIMLG